MTYILLLILLCEMKANMILTEILDMDDFPKYFHEHYHTHLFCQREA